MDPLHCFVQMSIMAWYPLPQSGGAPSAGDEFFENQAAGWSLWSFSPADGQHGAAKHGIGGGGTRAGQHTEGSPAPLGPQPTYDMFMSQLSDEEVSKMDAPFAALDMFPDSMHRLMSYENMLDGVLTGGSEGGQDQNGVDAMDTCGFPLFSHDLQSGSPSSPEILPVPVPVPDLTPIKDHQLAGTTSMAKRSRLVVAGEESEHDLEALVLEELEDVVIQLTKRTRICFRDAFLRLAESTGAMRSAANGASSGLSSSSSSSNKQAEDNTSRVSTLPGCAPPERETNAIDRTVACLMLTPLFAAAPPPPPQAHASRYAGDYSGTEAQSTTSWTAAA
ncbi:hypothetical protein U9M48_020129 [Paspalum notatum var. saurae]|uniref:Uncharacterized protein n=1 Tax=Paspalum notatum var. saurae TaxID=547442 RepID=A0AAQ3TFE4_PASNO